MSQLYCVYRRPFGAEPRVQRFREGLTFAEIVERMDLPRSFVDQGGTVCMNGHPVPHGAWHLVKPKAVTAGVANAITFHAPIRGGGDSGGKNPLAILGGLALAVLSGGAASGLFATAGGLFVKGSTSALFLAGGISLVGSLLLNALVPPPTLDQQGEAQQQRRDAAARGNVLDPNGSVPRVIGERRVFPPLAVEPLVTFDGDDEVVEAVYCLSGPHRLQDIRVGAAPIEDVAGALLETREGWPGQRPLTLIRRYGRTEATQREIRGHQVDGEDGALLDTSIDVGLAVPQAQVVATRKTPDTHELQLTFPQGLGRPRQENDLLRVPLRLRIRRIGGDWKRLPELHYQGADFRQLRATIRLHWRAQNGAAPTAATTKGFVAAFSAVPGQTAAPATAGWTADAYFYAGSGDTYASQNNLGSSGLRRYRMDRHVAEFFLDPAEFEPGRYEIEITRGCAIRRNDWSDANYQYQGNVRDLFGWFGTPARIPFSRADMTDTLALVRSVSIWNRPPVRSQDFALIAVRARNVSLERLSVLAGGYVPDWDGTGWRDWTVTSNPAPHYRDTLLGRQNADPLPAENLDDTGLVDWREACESAGHAVDAVLQDTSVGEALTVIAACGYARPYQSDRWGVVRDYDRSAEPPVQLITPRNSANFRWTKAFAKLPDGLRVTFADAAEDWEDRQITVWRKGVSRDGGLLEQVTYLGVTSEAEAIQRARYDLAQLELRATLFSLDMAAEALVCRRGALVGVVHDAVAEQAGFARVVEGGTDAVVLDAAVRCSDEPMPRAVTYFRAVPSVRALGTRTQAQIRYPDGEVALADLTNATGEAETLIFAETQVEVPAGALVSTRVLVPDYRRMIVFDMRWTRDYEATLTLVDEAPELFAA